MGSKLRGSPGRSVPAAVLMAALAAPGIMARVQGQVVEPERDSASRVETIRDESAARADLPDGTGVIARPSGEGGESVTAPAGLAVPAAPVASSPEAVAPRPARPETEPALLDIEPAPAEPAAPARSRDDDGGDEEILTGSTGTAARTFPDAARMLSGLGDGSTTIGPEATPRVPGFAADSADQVPSVSALPAGPLPAPVGIAQDPAPVTTDPVPGATADPVSSVTTDPVPGVSADDLAPPRPDLSPRDAGTMTGTTDGRSGFGPGVDVDPPTPAPIPVMTTPQPLAPVPDRAVQALPPGTEILEDTGLVANDSSRSSERFGSAPAGPEPLDAAARGIVPTTGLAVDPPAPVRDSDAGGAALDTVARAVLNSLMVESGLADPIPSPATIAPADPTRPAQEEEDEETDPAETEDGTTTTTTTAANLSEPGEAPADLAGTDADIIPNPVPDAAPAVVDELAESVLPLDPGQPLAVAEFDDAAPLSESGILDDLTTGVAAAAQLLTATARAPEADGASRAADALPQPNPVPEPSTLAPFGLLAALAAVGLVRRHAGRLR